MFVVDNLEHQREECAEYFVEILEVKAHVERLDVGQVLQQIKVPLESGVFGIFQTSQLFDEEVKDGLDLGHIFVGCFWRKDPQDVSNATGDKQLKRF